MSIKYKVVKRTFGYDPGKTPRYVAKAVSGQKLPFDRVCAQVAQICGVHRSMAVVIVSGLFDVLANNLDMGHTIVLGEFGYMSPGIRSRAQNNEKDATAQTIYRRKVNFTPGKMLKNFIQNTPVSRMVMTGVEYLDDL